MRRVTLLSQLAAPAASVERHWRTPGDVQGDLRVYAHVMLTDILACAHLRSPTPEWGRLPLLSIHRVSGSSR